MGTVASTRWAEALCWLAVLLDGYDLVVLGVVLPSLISEHVWGLTAATATAVSTGGLAGMIVGAFAVGTVTDVVGRRRALLLSVSVYSLFTVAGAFAPSALTFGILRFVVGLGSGGALPTALTLVSELHAARGEEVRAATRAMSGSHIGAMACALLGILLVPAFGWRAVMVVVGVAGLVLLVPMALRLPEPEPFLRTRGT